jgi:hypothetical protein
MKKILVFIAVCSVVLISQNLHAQTNEKPNFILSTSWSPKMFFDIMDESSTVIDISFSAVSLTGELSLTPRTSIYMGYQLDQRKNPEMIYIYDMGYYIRYKRVTGIPLGIKHYLTNPNHKVLLYSNIGINYTRLLTERNYNYPNDGPLETGERMDNLLMTDLGLGTSFSIGGKVRPFFEVFYSNSVFGSNSGVSFLTVKCGLSVVIK